VDAVDLRRLSSARAGEDPDGRPGPADGAGPVTPGDVVIRVDKRYYRPTEVESLIGDPSKARERLGWAPLVGFQELVSEMIAGDLDEARQHDLLRRRGFTVRNFRE
jgi:GDPmannose 4,6-dehydratase